MSYTKINLDTEAKKVLTGEPTKVSDSALLVILADAYLTTRKRK